MRLLREGGHRGLPAPCGILRGGESRRLCLLFPRGFPCVPHHYLEALFPGPAVIPVFGTAMSGLWASGSREMAWDRCPYHWENHKSGSLGDLGCSGVMVSCGFPVGRMHRDALCWDVLAAEPGRCLSLLSVCALHPSWLLGMLQGIAVGFAVEGRGCPSEAERLETGNEGHWGKAKFRSQLGFLDMRWLESGWVEIGEGFGHAQMDPHPAAARVGEAGCVY